METKSPGSSSDLAPTASAARIAKLEKENESLRDKIKDKDQQLTEVFGTLRHEIQKNVEISKQGTIPPSYTCSERTR